MKNTCAHCGQPCESSGNELSFCCTGCETVYHAIHDAGLERYYDLRGGDELPPLAGEYSQLENPQIMEQVRRNDDGTCEIDLYLDGVHCAGCVWIVEKMPQAMDGVIDARLNLSRARLTVRWFPEQVELKQMGTWLSRFGYSAHPLDGLRQHGNANENKMLLRLGVTWALAANVMLLAITLYSGLETGLEAGLREGARWLSLVLSAAAVFYGGQEFMRRAWASIVPWSGLHRLSVDVPITLGVLAGWFYSFYATLVGGGEVWFDSITVLIAALLTARYLQVRGRRHAGDAAERLLHLLPNTAHRVDADAILDVSTRDLKAGDILEVRLGEIVPVDGEVVDGMSLINRAAITGESRPEKITIGDLVSAGETVVSAVIRVRAAAVGEQTRVGRLMAWVESASHNRAPVVQMADRLSGWFVVAVLVASALTFGLWSLVSVEVAVAHTVALLVISCPCALGMATPLALTVGMGRAARRGIFIKHDDVLESLDKVEVMIFDKTGTLTQNATRIVAVEGDSDALEMAAALEAKSTHPIAAAFVMRPKDAVVEEVHEVSGSGIEGRVNGKWVRVGRPDWLGSSEDHTALMVRQCLTPVAIEVDGQVMAVVGIGDPLRPESESVIAGLHHRGIKTILLSGDHPEIVEQVAKSLGISEAYGAQTPESKLQFVTEARSRGVVAMVGDGINDASALQAADIGIAVHGGSDLNLIAADIFLTRPGLHAVMELVEGAENVMQVVRRNLAGSSIYNVVGMALAGFGLVNPLVAAVAMPVSSLSVVVSSLLQRSFREEPTRGNHVDSLSARTPGISTGWRGGADVSLGGTQPPV